MRRVHLPIFVVLGCLRFVASDGTFYSYTNPNTGQSVAGGSSADYAGVDQACSNACIMVDVQLFQCDVAPAPDARSKCVCPVPQVRASLAECHRCIKNNTEIPKAKMADINSLFNNCKEFDASNGGGSTLSAAGDLAMSSSSAMAVPQVPPPPVPLPQPSSISIAISVASNFASASASASTNAIPSNSITDLEIITSSLSYSGVTDSLLEPASLFYIYLTSLVTSVMSLAIAVL